MMCLEINKIPKIYVPFGYHMGNPLDHYETVSEQDDSDPIKARHRKIRFI